MSVGFDCDIKVIDDALRNARRRNPEKATEIDRRVRQLTSRLHLAAEPPPVGLTDEAALEAQIRFKTIMQATEVADVSPGSVNSLGFMLAQNFALVKRGFGLADSFTEPGAVRFMLTEMKRRGAGEVHQILANAFFIDDMLKADRALENIRRSANVPRDKWHRIKLDAIEIGMHPSLQRDYGAIGPVGIEILEGRQRRFYDLLESAALSRSQTEELSQVVQTIANRYNSTLEIVKAMGIKVNDASGVINYLPRTFSPEAIRRIGWYTDDAGGYGILNLDGSSARETLPSAFTKARGSDIFAVEDRILLDAALTGAVPDIYEKLGVESIEELLEDTGALTRAFAQHLDKRSPELFDALVDSGILSKIPMTSTELIDYMVARYSLPFKQVDEIMPYNLADMGRTYRAQAERLAGRSLMAHYTAKSAIENGWGITEAQRLADPEQYADFVKLSSPVDPNVVITAEEARRFGMPVFQYSNVYVHPVVAQMYRAQTRVLTDPVQMGVIGKLLYELRTTFSAQALTSTGFIFRQLYTPIFQVWAGGGRLDTYASDMMRTLKNIAQLQVSGRSMDTFFQTFDNTNKIYRGPQGQLISEQELWTQLRRRGVVQEIIPWIGANLNNASYVPTKITRDNPLGGAVRSVRDTARYLKDIVANYPELGVNGALGRMGEIVNLAGNGTRKISDQAFHWVGASNVLIDNVARFSLIKSLTDTTDVNRLARAAQGNILDGNLEFEQAILKAGDFFFDYSDLGNVDRVMRHVRPFYMFMSRNTFSIWRMMVRNPSRFVNYNRLWAALNPPEDREGVPYGASPDWLRTESPLYWVQRDDDGNPAGFIALPRSSFDPIAEGSGTMTEYTDQLLYHMGVWPAARMPSVGVSDRINDLPWEQTRTNQALNTFVEGSYGHWKVAVAAITGEDVTFGTPLRGAGVDDTSFLGVKMSPMARYAAENLFPLLRNVNRSNPFYIFGTPPKVENGKIVSYGTPAWWGFGAARSSRDRSADFRAWWQRSLSTVGFNTFSVDILEQMGWRHTEIAISLNEGRDYILNRQRELLDSGLSDSELQAELIKLEEMRTLYAALSLEYAEVQEFARQRNMTMPAALRYLQREQIRTNTLQNLPPEESERIIRSFYGISAEEYWNDRR